MSIILNAVTKNKKFKHVRLTSVLIVISLLCGSVALPQSKPADPLQEAERIKNAVDNGIFVDSVKVYDDSSLQLMLNAARLRLAALQSFDQTGLLSRIGAITGATLRQQAISAQVLGPPLPQTAVTDLGATSLTTTVNAPTGLTTTTAAGQPVQNVVTTTPQMTAAVPQLPANSASLPTGFNVSSLDALNEMMQLTYEIANLQLLLEGSLSDRFVKGERLVKPRTTLGFPITVTPQKTYKDAVAVVEIEAINPSLPGSIFGEGEPPTVTALLPREKTYNVAAITDRMTSIGGGFVSQVINGGFSYLRGRKSYYIVQDQDTLATMQRGTPESSVFSWQFRPVLGQAYVRPGLKQTFVQLAAPIMANSGCFGKIKIKTYWRKYDRKHGILKEIIPESIRVDNYKPIPVFDLAPVIGRLTYKDLGSGLVQASVEGRFLNGTYIRVGNNFYREGSPGFTSELTQIRFVASAADIAKYKAYLVSRDGTETEIIRPAAPIIRPPLRQTCDAPQQQRQPVRAEGFTVRTDKIAQQVNQGDKAQFGVSIGSVTGSNESIVLSTDNLPDGFTSRWSNGRNSTRILEISTDTYSPLGIFEFDVVAERNGEKSVIPLTIQVRPGPKVDIKISAYDNSNSVITAELSNIPADLAIEEYVVFLGGKVFGLSDAPIERFRVQDAAGRPSSEAVLRLVVSNSLLLSSTEIEVKPLFWREDFGVSELTGLFNSENSTEKIVIYEQTTDKTTFLLYGNRLENASILVPSGIELKPFDESKLPSGQTNWLKKTRKNTLLTFELTTAQLKAFKQIVLQKSPGERPIMLSLPAPGDADKKPALTVKGRIILGTDEVAVQGDNLDKLKFVRFKGKEVKFNLSNDKKSVTLIQLVTAGVTSVAMEQELEFEFEGGAKGSLKLDIVNSKIEMIERSPN